MRVSIVNFVSTALEMLKFSSEMLLQNAGTEDFDYLVVTWNPTNKVAQWIWQHEEIIPISYNTNMQYAYVPNLRLMFNRGFEAGYNWNDWVAIVNTDMAFGKDWLANLMRRASEQVIPNSLHLAPISGPNIITADLGIPAPATFNMHKFWRLHDRYFADLVETEEDRGDWRACATLPYIVHKTWWEACGPWEPEHEPGEPPPDRKFFERCHRAGAKFVLCHDSIVYHHEAVERRSGRRPIGVEDMPEGK